MRLSPCELFSSTAWGRPNPDLLAYRLRTGYFIDAGHARSDKSIPQSLMANVKRRCYSPLTEVKSCRLTISDVEGVAHSVEVTAATLYEAVALGLRELQGNEWVEGIARGLNTVRVAVKNVQVEHTGTMGEFTKWLERRGGTPAEMTRSSSAAVFHRLT
jgi:hypothetical protein